MASSKTQGLLALVWNGGWLCPNPTSATYLVTPCGRLGILGPNRLGAVFASCCVPSTSFRVPFCAPSAAKHVSCPVHLLCRLRGKHTSSNILQAAAAAAAAATDNVAPAIAWGQLQSEDQCCGAARIAEAEPRDGSWLRSACSVVEAPWSADEGTKPRFMQHGLYIYAIHASRKQR